MDTTVYASRTAVKKRTRTSSKAVHKINKLTIVKWIVAVALIVGFTILTEVVAKPDIFMFFALGAGLIILFHKGFSIKKYGRNFISGWQFWVWTAVSVALLIGADQLKKYMLWTMFVGQNSGIIQIWQKENYIGVVFYAITMIIILPLAENLFICKGLLSGKNKIALFVLAIAGLFVRGLFYAHGFYGILSYAVVAIPIVLVYLKTKNMYITLTAQIIVSAYLFIPDIAYDVARLMLR